MKMFTMHGRARRSEHFRHNIGGILLCLFSMYLFHSAISSESKSDALVFFSKIFIIAMFIFVFADGVCITVRRLHDLNRPGSHYFMLCIPFYNFYLEYQLWFKKGFAGSNQFDSEVQQYPIKSETQKTTEEYFCGRCGSEIKWGDVYCQHCGDVLEY
jgi:Predicted membrane protein